MPRMLPSRSSVVLSLKQECSSSWSLFSYAVSMRSPESSDAASVPMPVSMRVSDSTGAPVNVAV